MKHIKMLTVKLGMPIRTVYTRIDTTVTGRAYYMLTGWYLEFCNLFNIY